MSENLELSGSMEPGIPQFPMVVFLRGDEAHFTDFCMSADQVMDVLGIRRSRLNQISGRELRVGRARIDSYVRPVYRKQDVEEYLKWMRPTATHKKSSDLLNDARSKLEEQSAKLSLELSSRFESMVETFTSNFQNQFFEQRNFTKSALTIMQKTLKVTLRTILQRSAFVQSQSLARWEELRQRFEDIQALRKDLEQFKAATVQISDMVRYSERVLLDMQNSQKELQEKTNLLLGNLEDIGKTLSKSSSDLPLVRYRRGDGVYSRVRKEFENTQILSPLKVENPNFVPSWRRKKVSVNNCMQ